MAKNKSFIDSNLWIYALIEDQDQKKHNKVVKLLESLVKDQIIVSIQIINEVHWVLQRKYKFSDSEIKKKILYGIFPIVEITSLNKNTYLNSAIVREQYSVSFWDSLVVSSAINNGCFNLYSEDLQHGQKILNQLNIINPFK